MRKCIIFELRSAGWKAEKQIAVPVIYKDINIKLRGSPYKLKYYNTKKKQTLVLLRAFVVYIF
jgi:type I site-specific restriction endonuclease